MLRYDHVRVVVDCWIRPRILDDLGILDWYLLIRCCLLIVNQLRRIITRLQWLSVQKWLHGCSGRI